MLYELTQTIAPLTHELFGLQTMVLIEASIPLPIGHNRAIVPISS